MQKLCFFLSVLVVSSLLVSCDYDQPAYLKALEDHFESSGTATPSSAAVSALAADVVSSIPPKNCPITVPQDPPFTPPAPYDSLGYDGEFWYGSNSLWTAVRENGTWEALPHNPEGYTQKVFWWRDGYVWNEEPQPALTVTGERLDAPAPPLKSSPATNASASDIGSAMLVGVDLPTLGCWRITGKYGDAELSFVVWVAP